jgi:hypothetical protein
MRARVNKPRVFLSYASRDVGFIERMVADLLRCQIEPWRDRTEIRDGEPWQESIFEQGLPTCDVIIAYFTDSALKSGMVGREVDAAQIRQLKDSGVSFLPYVSSSDTRGKLRLDIQRLQCREWNHSNYHEVLPSVVAEIWRSYMERNVGNVTLQERNKRLELEIELQTLKAQSNSAGFTPQEEKEFRYIYGKLDEPREMSIRRYKEEKSGTVAGFFTLLQLFSSFVTSSYLPVYEKSDFEGHILVELQKAYPDDGYLGLEFKKTLAPNSELMVFSIGRINRARTRGDNRSINSHKDYTGLSFGWKSTVSQVTRHSFR